VLMMRSGVTVWKSEVKDLLRSQVWYVMPSAEVEGA